MRTMLTTTAVLLALAGPAMAEPMIPLEAASEGFARCSALYDALGQHQAQAGEQTDAAGFSYLSKEFMLASLSARTALVALQTKGDDATVMTTAKHWVVHRVAAASVEYQGQIEAEGVHAPALLSDLHECSLGQPTAAKLATSWQERSGS